MKAGTSSLNPYAASYIPLSRRGVAHENRGYELSAKDSRSGNQAVWMRPHHGDTTQSQYQKSYQNYNSHGGGDTLQIAEDSKLKGHSVYASYGSSSQNPNEMTEKLTPDEEYDMDLVYLQMTFPGISDESLSGVYIANKGDLEATVDMLNQLELYSVDSSEKLPDTLDIGDVSEATSSECASLKLEKAGSEVTGSRIQPLSPD